MTSARFIFLCILILGFLLIATLASIAGLYFWDDFTFTSRIRAGIPAKIKTAEVLTKDYNPGFGPGGSCGGASFRLTDETAEKIRTEGLAFFDDAEFPNPIVTLKNREPESWRPWRKAPVPPEEKHFTRLGLRGCTDNFLKLMTEKKIDRKKETDSYYSYVRHRGYSTFWIFPNQGIIVYSYYE